MDWSSKTVSVRINGLDTHYCYRDVVDIVEQAGDKLDLIMIPKAGTAADIYAIDMLVTQIEAAKGYTTKIGFEMIIETALGMENIHEIAAASPRNESLHFGVADYAASTKARTTNIGGPNADYHVLTGSPGGRAPRRALGRHVALRHRPDGGCSAGQRPAADRRPVRRTSGTATAMWRRRSGPRSLGCEGKWAIHPTQIDLANDVFSPSEKAVAQAQAILDAMEEAQKQGRGAVTLNGKLIDIASIKQAKVLVDTAAQIAGNT